VARIARIVVPGFPHHVTQRGNRRQNTFFCDDDFRFYMYLVAEYCNKVGTEIWAYCLMPNHVHFVMVPKTRDGLRAAIGEAHRRYTLKINTREQWRGHLWQERFHSFVMDESHLLSAVKYIELNPVAANLCTRPEHWPWSSANAHLAGTDDLLVKVTPMLSRVNNYSEYLDHPPNHASINRLELHCRTGRPLGTENFLSRVSRIVNYDVRPRKPGRKNSRSREG
jgi:putative transposase